MSFKTELQSNNTDLQAILTTINNLPDAGGSVGLEWICCNTLPISYASAPGGQSYYIELPSEKCFVLFYNENPLGSYRMGTYDVEQRMGSFALASVYKSDDPPSVIKDSESFYLSISFVSTDALNNTYYAIIIAP